MATRKRSTTTKSIEKKILEGRCKHSGREYIPWFKVQDVASKGTSLKTFSQVTKRQHHLLSRLETFYFYILEWSDVKDIKEQFAILDVDETIKIASKLGYKHPRDPRTHLIVPITTDFLVEIEKDGKKVLLARTIKYTNDLKKRTLEKFEIEKIYWESKGIDWGIVTEQVINKNLINNIIWVRKAILLEGLPDLDEEKVAIIEQLLWNEIKENNRGISEIAEKVTNMLGLQSGTGLFVVRYLIANKYWKVDMYKPINPNSLLEILERNYLKAHTEVFS